MAAYLYCVLPDDAPDPTVSGIDDAQLHTVRAGGVCAWVAEVATAPQPDLERIRAHDRVVRAAMDAGFTPVPVRFGQVASNDDDVRAHLESRDYLPDLARVSGCVEFGIRVVDPDAPAGVAHAHAGTGAGREQTGSGAAYMRTLASRVHAAERSRARSLDAARALDEGLAEWVREARVEASERPPGALVAHLVQTSAADTYAERARALTRGHSPLRIVVTGPWPPYSFVGT